MEGAQAAPALARARIRDFWGGVYESSCCAARQTYYVKIGRNNSQNTLCSGVFLDTLVGDLGPFQDMGGTWMGRWPTPRPRPPPL